MRTILRIVPALMLVALLPVAAVAQEEEPYSGGDIPDTTIASQIDAVVLGLTATLSIPGEGSCTWDFGDGTAGEGNPVTHTFSEAGEFNVTADCDGTIYTRQVIAGELASTGVHVSTFLLWGGGLLLAGSAALIFGRSREEE